MSADGGGSDSEKCKKCKIWRDQEFEDSETPCCDDDADSDEEDRCCRDAQYASTCIRPAPRLNPSVRLVWSLWERTQGPSYTLFVSGMKIVSVGKNIPAVESQARAMGVPWDELTTKWYGMIVDAWLTDQARKQA